MSASGPPREPSRASDRTCIVVGAGAAGLSCALRLQQHGVRVTLLEAADRVGGRCLTTSVGDLGVFELGAQWFHGQKGNPAFALAESLGLTPQTPKRRATTPRHLRSDGRPANADVSLPLPFGGTALAAHTPHFHCAYPGGAVGEPTPL